MLYIIKSSLDNDNDYNGNDNAGAYSCLALFSTSWIVEHLMPK